MPWSVAQLRPNAARIACENLRRQSFQYYNPRFNDRVVLRGGAVTWRRTQLFKDYLFVEVCDRWRSLLSTIGVLRLLMAREEQPAFLPDGYVDGLRDREDDNGLVVLDRVKFKRGQSVQVKEGSFAYHVGVYAGQSASDRAIVLMSLLGGDRRMEFKEANLRAA